jgi:hypothetical protein
MCRIWNQYKKTATDIIIPMDSKHPREHKLAAIRYLINTIQSYPISDDSISTENHILRQILQANSYLPRKIDPILHKLQLKNAIQPHTLTQTNNNNLQNDSQSNKKFAVFTYVGKETKFVTKLFKHTSIQIAYKTPNTTGNLLSHRQQPKIDDKLNKSGIYQLECLECNMKYIGQTERSFQERYQEHMRDYKYGTGSSKFAQHLTDYKHTCSPINNTLKILKIVKKKVLLWTHWKDTTYIELHLKVFRLMTRAPCQDTRYLIR